MTVREADTEKGRKSRKGGKKVVCAVRREGG